MANRAVETRSHRRPGQRRRGEFVALGAAHAVQIADGLLLCQERVFDPPQLRALKAIWLTPRQCGSKGRRPPRIRRIQMADYSRQTRHGAGCDCRLLAAATHSHRDAIPFSYCLKVLQKRYSMTCRHGEAREFPVPALPQWTDIGCVDAVKAILVANRS